MSEQETGPRPRPLGAVYGALHIKVDASSSFQGAAWKGLHVLGSTLFKMLGGWRMTPPTGRWSSSLLLGTPELEMHRTPPKDTSSVQRLTVGKKGLWGGTKCRFFFLKRLHETITPQKMLSNVIFRFRIVTGVSRSSPPHPLHPLLSPLRDGCLVSSGFHPNSGTSSSLELGSGLQAVLLIHRISFG